MALLTPSSCDLNILDSFRVRPSEEPEGGATDYELPRNPMIVLSNLRNAVNARDAVVYEDVFTENLVFVPDAKDALDLENYYPGVFDDWNVEVERAVGNLLLDPARSDFILLIFTEEPDPIEETDSTYVVQRSYQMTLVTERWDTYYGTAIFSIRLLPDGLWYLYKWEDFRPEARPEGSSGTWGLLKGEIRATI